MRLSRAPGLIFGCSLLLSAAASGANGFVGAAVCASCHPAQASRQASTGHAAALRRAGDHPLASAFFLEGTKARMGGFQFRFLSGPAVRISQGADSVDVPIEWAFGAGAQAVTFVSRVDADHYVEHFFSYYTALNRLGPTPGQRNLAPNGLAEAAGLYYKTRDKNTGIDGCFECHSTGALQFDSDRAIVPSEPGVRCEACHGPGAQHVEAAKHGDGGRFIENPARLSAGTQLEFCGRCHRPPASKGQDIDWSYVWNVRHQPVYLSKSACFRLSKGALTCLTCHAAHQPLERSAAAYNSQCSRCHRQTPGACGANCVDCHMPRVSPQAPLRFTNHWIGVYKSAAKLRPVALH